MQLLALDFDGVISDSAREAFVVARRTFLELRPESRLRGHEPEAVYARFLELMPLGNRAEDYATALAAIERGERLPDQAAYDAFRARQDPEWLRGFHRRFYEVRASFAAGDPTGWRSLLRPYPDFLAILRRHAGRVPYAIATAKDRGSVHALLRDYRIDDLFEPEYVLDKETGVTKVAHLEHLQRRLQVPFPAITFLDDKVNHLDSVARLGVRCALAAWGYNGPREHALAHAHGHLVCTLADVERQLFTESPGAAQGGSGARSRPGV